MRQSLGTFSLMLLMAAGSAHAGDKVDFEYALGSEAVRSIDPTLARQFNLEGDALKVELKRPSHLYLILESANGRLRLAWPDPGGDGRGGSSLPRTTMLRIEPSGSSARTWLVVSTAPVPELEGLILARRTEVPREVAEGLQQKHPVMGLMQREVDEKSVSVKLSASGTRPAVVVEEVSR